MSRIAALCLFLPACEPTDEPKETGDSDTDSDSDTDTDTDSDSDSDTDTDTDTGSGLDTTQSGDDVLLNHQLWASGHVVGTVLESGAYGTVSYNEWIDDELPHCTATLEFESVGAAADCMGCDWSQSVVATEVGHDGECAYGHALSSFTPGEGQEVYFGWYTDYTDDFGDSYQELLNLVLQEESGWEMYYPHAIDGDGNNVGAEAYDVATGAIDFDLGGTGIGEIPALWLECDAEPMEADAASLSGGTMVSGLLECDWFDVLADSWTFELAAGDKLHATIDSPTSRTEMKLWLVGPDGCAMAEAVAENRCAGNGNCPTLSYEAATAGEWTLVVSYDDCDDDPIEYSVDLVVE